MALFCTTSAGLAALAAQRRSQRVVSIQPKTGAHEACPGTGQSVFTFATVD